MTASPAHFAKIYDMFSAAIAKELDCGRVCAPLNDGSPVCCSTENAIPIVEKEEWQLLKSRTDLWSKYKPTDAASRKVVKELPSTTCAVECKGAAFCERDNRSLACRSFPFYPYITADREIIGLSYYWVFEDRCWVISNLQVVERKFIKQMMKTYEYLFEKDEDQFEAFYDQSASMRRTFSRWNRPIPIIGRKGGYFMVLPKSGGQIVKTTVDSFMPAETFSSNKAYKKAIKEAGGDPKGHRLPKRSFKN